MDGHAAVRWATIEALLRHGGWFAFFLVLAPILGPRDVGLFVLAMGGIAMVETLFGEVAAQPLIRLGRLEATHLSTAFLTITGVGATISLLLYAIAGAIAAMFEESALGDMFQSLALLPMLSAMTALPCALLRRNGRPAPCAIASGCGQAFGGAVAIMLAVAGAGPWSLVAQMSVQRFVEIALLWGIAGRGIGIGWSRRAFAELIGAFDLAALAPLLRVLSREAPRLLVGVALGPVAAGLYLVAGRVAEACHDILLAPLALASGGTGGIVRAVRRIALPAVLGSTALAAIALPALLDMRWWGAVRPLQFLLLGVLAAALLPARAAARSAATLVLSGLAVAALTVPYGLTALAAALLLHGLGAIAVVLAGAPRPRAGAAGRAIAGLWAPLVAAIATGVLLSNVAGWVGTALAPGMALMVLSGCGAAAYRALLSLFESGRTRPPAGERRTAA